MTDTNKFEEMLEKLVNEDREGAEELFHEIVVEKSREIYQSIIETEEEVEETTDEEVDEATDEEVDESEDDLDEATDEEVDESEEEVDESEDDIDEMFGLDDIEAEADDPVMDLMKDAGADDEEGDDMDMDAGDEEGDMDHDDLEDKVMDLEDALEDLKAEFEKMMGDEAGDDEEPEEEGYAFEASDEEVDEASDEEVDEASDEEVDEAADEETDESTAPKSAGEQMREYVEKVSATMGDNGANTKSTVAGPNNMGGTAANIAAGGESKSEGTGASAPKEDNAGNVNVPGGKASKSMKSQPGHGAEKKGKPETADNKKSMMGS